VNLHHVLVSLEIRTQCVLDLVIAQVEILVIVVDGPRLVKIVNFIITS
jgi:hypothetical protein